MSKKKKADFGELLVCRNPKAEKDFDIDERLEAGMVLLGSEVKSLRARRADLEGAYASADGGALWLHKMHIGPYEQASVFNHESKRSRKLLLHQSEIRRWEARLRTRGYTVIPLAVYFKGGYAKVQLGLGKARKAKDRRHELKKQVELKEARSAADRGKGR